MGVKIITCGDAQKDLDKMLHEVCDEHSPVIITDGEGREAVLINLPDYESIKETLYLMKSPENYRQLLSSIEHAEVGKTSSKQLKDSGEP